MDLNGVFSVIAFVVGIVLLLPLIVGAVFVVVVVANRADPDVSGRRPASVYAFATAFITLFVTLFATTSLVASLCRLIGSHDDAGATPVGTDFFTPDTSSFGGHLHPIGDSVARGAVLSGLVALIAGVVFALHLRAAARASADVPAPEPLVRVRSSYVAAVSFVSVVIVVIASVVGIYDIFRIIAPGVFSESGQGGRVEVLRSLIPAFYLAAAALVILAAHLRHTPPPFRPAIVDRWRGGPGSATADAPAPVLAPPVVPGGPVTQTDVIESQPARPAPRKRAPRKTTPPQ